MARRLCTESETDIRLPRGAQSRPTASCTEPLWGGGEGAGAGVGVGAGVGTGVGAGGGGVVFCGGATPVASTLPQPSFWTQVWIDTTWLVKWRFEQPALLALASQQGDRYAGWVTPTAALTAPDAPTPALRSVAMGHRVGRSRR